jgi:hypothetical protein
MTAGVGYLRDLTAVVIHHSATPRSVTFEALRRGHLNRGWTDIGYHAVVLGNGDLRQGRPLPRAGAHAPPLNFETLALCVVGDNTKPEHKWTAAQITTAKEYLDAVALLWPGLRVLGHRDARAGHTECPGFSLPVLLSVLGRLP